MTDARGSHPWYVRPAVMLPVIFGIIVAVAVLTPDTVNGRAGDARLTTYSSGPLGARGLYELAGRLGWRVDRRLSPTVSDADTTTIEAVLSPAIAPTDAQTRALLANVRRGGALLFVLGAGTGLAESLHVRLGDGFRYAPVLRGTDSLDAARCPANASPGLPLWLGDRPLLSTLRWTRPVPPDTVTFAVSQPARRGAPPRPAAVGFPFGRGRVVVAADPDLLRNDVLRTCAWNADVVAVRMLEYLSGGTGQGSAPRERIAFDEYHQGYGLQPGTMRAITVYLGRTPSGHVLAQLALAGLLLLLAVGPRALPPRADARVERRSPLEHVDALARAYAAVGATRTAAARLLHGVRRRLGRTGRGSLDEPDDAFLDRAARRAPPLAGDVALVRRALGATISASELETLGAALRRIESALTNLPP